MVLYPHMFGSALDWACEGSKNVTPHGSQYDIAHARYQGTHEFVLPKVSSA